ncbi:unnamed protein product [Arabis nemorensis]|uniref:Uncharacterized protein n=1 Tax=Arabis nemorensis TaxID=586526 RepID=A0A565BUP0_9BRAS|nr:unnamed protein product [Arabis nemorensis]
MSPTSQHLRLESDMSGAFAYLDSKDYGFEVSEVDEGESDVEEAYGFWHLDWCFPRRRIGSKILNGGSPADEARSKNRLSMVRSEAFRLELSHGMD